MSEKTNNSPAVSFGLLPVSVRLELIGEHNGATAVARSCLVEGQRTIRVGICQDHLLLSRALQRADVLTVRFLVALSLVEFTQFWSNSRDGASVNRELRKLAGFAPSENAFGSSYASRLAICESMRVIDSLPIYAREPQRGPFTLLELELPMRSPSDVTNWRAKNGQTEVLKPLPPKGERTRPTPAVTASPDPFLTSFHRATKEMLSAEDFAVLEELAKGEGDA